MNQISIYDMGIEKPMRSTAAADDALALREQVIRNKSFDAFNALLYISIMINQSIIAILH